MAINLAELLIIGASMSGVVIEEPVPAATEQQVVAFEKQIGYSLPNDYRHFLLTVNGGGINKKILKKIRYPVKPIIEGSVALDGYADFRDMYSLFDGFEELIGKGADRSLTLPGNYRAFREMEGEGFPHVPPYTIPIADYYGQAVLLLALDGPYKNQVLFYGYNHVGDPAELYGNVSWVADSFTGFLNVLEPVMR